MFSPLYGETNLAPLYGPSNPPYGFAGEIQKDTLPSDLDSAYRGAFWAVRSANTILDFRSPSVAPYDAPVPLIFLFDEWQRSIDCTVRQVADQIAQARDKRKPIRFGNLVAATHHELALEYAGFVFSTIYRALVKAAKLPSVCTVETPPYRELFFQHWQNIAPALTDTPPLERKFFAALKLEALRTAERRRKHSAPVAASQGDALPLNVAKPIADDPSAANGTKRKAKRRKAGRPVDTDVKQDRRLYDAWQTGRYRIIRDLAAAFNLREKDARRAIDRERKRRKK